MLLRFKSLFRTRGGGAKPVILMYHRVADLDLDPWGLAVSPAHFADQLNWLRAHRKPIRLAEFVTRLVRGGLPAEAVALTFDDGYADNLYNALPTLGARGMFATLFLVTGQRDHPVPFWWDELARLVLYCESAVHARIAIAGTEHVVRWSSARRKDRRGWRASDSPRDAQEAAYVKLWTALQRISSAERANAMKRLRDLLGPTDGAADLPMSSGELTLLAASKVFDIGAHSSSHPALTSLSAEDRRREIVESQRACETLIGRPVPGFAYPYGDLDKATRSEVVAAGFAFACSTRNDFVRSQAEDLFALPRISVGDLDGEAFQRLLTAA